MMNQLKEYLQGLSERERKLVSIGALVVGALLYYSLIWEPLHNSVVSLRQEIRKNESLLTWMERAQVTLKIDKKGKKNNQQSRDQSILTLTEQLIAKQQLSSNVKEIKQVDKSKVQVRFEDVAYKNFIAWLDTMFNQYRVSIEKISIKRTKVAGTVNVNITIKR